MDLNGDLFSGRYAYSVFVFENRKPLSDTVDQDDHLNMIAEIFEERERKRNEDKLDERDCNSDVIRREKLIGEHYIITVLVI